MITVRTHNCKNTYKIFNEAICLIPILIPLEQKLFSVNKYNYMVHSYCIIYTSCCQNNKHQLAITCCHIQKCYTYGSSVCHTYLIISSLELHSILLNT